MNTLLRYQSSRPTPGAVAFSSTRNFLRLQHDSSVLAIRILEQSLRFNRSNEANVTFARQRNRRFPSYVKSPSLMDDFIFYTNVLPFELESISFNISRDFARGTRTNLPRNPSVLHFRAYGTLKAVDGDLSTCWYPHRPIQPNDFYAIDFLSIQNTTMFVITVAHSPQLQTHLAVHISFDGLFWVSYRSMNGIYKRENATSNDHRSVLLFDSSEFNIGFRSFRYISFKALKHWDEKFQVCEINMVSKERITNIKQEFNK